MVNCCFGTRVAHLLRLQAVSEPTWATAGLNPVAVAPTSARAHARFSEQGGGGDPALPLRWCPGRGPGGVPVCVSMASAVSMPASMTVRVAVVLRAEKVSWPNYFCFCRMCFLPLPTITSLYCSAPLEGVLYRWVRRGGTPHQNYDMPMRCPCNMPLINASSWPHTKDVSISFCSPANISISVEFSSTNANYLQRGIVLPQPHILI